MASTKTTLETQDGSDLPKTEPLDESKSENPATAIEPSSEEPQSPSSQSIEQCDSDILILPLDSDKSSHSKDLENLDDESHVSPKVVEMLTNGFLSEFLPNLQKSQATLSEVTENQRILIETLQQENAKFAESDALVEVQNMMSKAKLYQNKLLSMRKDMVALHDKSAKLKKRALKLQQQKHREILQQEQQRDRDMDRELRLVAKLATDKR